MALDRIIEAEVHLRRASSGQCTFAFTPDPSRTFNRGGTDYFLTALRNRPGSPDTPKSRGREIGRVRKVHAHFFEIETSQVLANGDGLCFFDSDDTLVGLRVNRVEGAMVFPKDRVGVAPGTILYRNLDIDFLRQLQQSENCRKIAATVTLSETPHGLAFTIEDEDGCRSSVDTTLIKERARNPEMMREILSQQARKSGGTIFSVQQVVVNIEKMLHLPVSMINDIRRKAFEAHLRLRLQQHQIPQQTLIPNSMPWTVADPVLPVAPTNRKALAFFARHGFSAFGSLAGGEQEVVLMTCRYCLKAQLRLCPVLNGDSPGPAEPLTLTDKTGTYELAFDCRRCEMKVLLRPLQHPLDRE
jgi:putative protease